MRTLAALAVTAMTAYYRARAELPGWAEMLRGRNIRALRRRWDQAREPQASGRTQTSAPVTAPAPPTWYNEGRRCAHCGARPYLIQ